MKVKLTPESQADRRWLRERAERGGSASIDWDLPGALNRAAEKWVAKHTPKPGPGSLLRLKGGGGYCPLRVVRSDGVLMDLDGDWAAGIDWNPADYDLVLEMHGE